MTRSRPPRDLARDPETWPHALIDDPAAAVVQDIARTLATTLADQGRSLRRAAEGSGVNRQAIADLIAGRCWPDIATVARLENFLAVTLYPPGGGMRRTHGKQPFRPPASAAEGATK
ncbi:helix-turn-helix domain-containing protein [Streptomyces caatingaensis]|uniref:helix-turn-helix domain-containing protein n=1 Tax=Streptomyces caatingaensis TaxID=1678637 RepID=UPI0019D6C24E|nr:helix-turn-helix transcriptional regulator [Streptomyces caatingaensis]